MAAERWLTSEIAVAPKGSWSRTMRSRAASPALVTSAPCTASSGRALGLSTPATPGCFAQLTAEVAELLAVTAHASALQQHLGGRDDAGREAGGRRPRGLGGSLSGGSAATKDTSSRRRSAWTASAPSPTTQAPPRTSATTRTVSSRAAARDTARLRFRRGLAGQNSPRPKMASRAGSRVTETTTAVSTDSESTGPKARRKPDSATSMAAQPAATAMPATSTIRPVWAAEALAAVEPVQAVLQARAHAGEVEDRVVRDDAEHQREHQGLELVRRSALLHQPAHVVGHPHGQEVRQGGGQQRHERSDERAELQGHDPDDDRQGEALEQQQVAVEDVGLLDLRGDGPGHPDEVVVRLVHVLLAERAGGVDLVGEGRARLGEDVGQRRGALLGRGEDVLDVDDRAPQPRWARRPRSCPWPRRRRARQRAAAPRPRGRTRCVARARCGSGAGSRRPPRRLARSRWPCCSGARSRRGRPAAWWPAARARPLRWRPSPARWASAGRRRTRRTAGRANRPPTCATTSSIRPSCRAAGAPRGAYLKGGAGEPSRGLWPPTFWPRLGGQSGREHKSGMAGGTGAYERVAARRRDVREAS